MLAAAVLLAGCGTQFKVQHIPSERLAEEAARVPGIYFALPKTVIDLAVPIELEGSVPGKRSDFDACQAQCASDSAGTCRMALKPDSISIDKASVLKPTLSTRAVPDPHQVYRSDVPINLPFIGVDHALTFGEPGVLKSTDLSGNNGLLDMVAGVVKTVASANLMKFSNKHTPDEPLPDDPPDLIDKECKPLDSSIWVRQRWPNELGRRQAVLEWYGKKHKDDASKGTTMSCAAVKCLTDTLKMFDKQALNAREEAQQAEKEISALAREPSGAGTAALRIEQSEKAADSLDTRREALRKTLGLSSEPFKETVTVLPRQPLLSDPQPLPTWQTLDGNWDLRFADDVPNDRRKPAEVFINCVLTTVGCKVADPKRRQKPIVVNIDREEQASIGGSPSAAGVTGTGDGYRYRLPALAKITVKHDDVVLLSQDIRVAQFGQLVELPSRFDGLNAKLGFELNDDGTLKSVKIGQSAQTTTALGSLGGTLQERRDAKASAAGAAAKAASAEAQITSRRQALCLKALDRAGPDASELPAVCDGL